MKKLRVSRCSFAYAGQVVGVCLFIAAWLLKPHPIEAQLIGPTNLFTQPFDATQTLISFSPENRRQLFRESDTVSIQTSNNQPVTVFDLRGNMVYQGAPTTLQFSRGHYFVETDGDRNQFAVLPDDYAGASFLGTGPDNGWNVLSDKLQQIQPTWVRTGAGAWGLVQPQRDVWDWSGMDFTVSSNPDKKIISCAADMTPSWVQSDELVQRYTEFVSTMAARYKGKLAAIEIWNEPWYSKFPNGTNLDINGFVRLYLDLHTSGRQAIKSVDHKVLVIGPAWGFLRLESLSITASNLNLFDGWSWHDYNLGRFAPDHDYLAPDWCRSITREHLQWCFGSNTVRKTMFVDELGLFGQSALGCPFVEGDALIDWHTGMCRAIKALLLYRAAGVACVIPFVIELGNEGPNPNAEIFGWDYGYRGPHPKTSAFLMTCYWLSGAKLRDSRIVDDQLYLYAWKRPRSGLFVVAWCAEGQTRALSSVSGFTTTDIYGQPVQATTLGEEPILFHPIKGISPRKALEAIAGSIQNQQ